MLLRALLLGRDRSATRRWLAVAALLFFVSLAYFAGVKRFDAPPVVLVALWWEGYALLLGVAVVVQAFENDGLLVSWLLTFVAVAGVVLNYGGIALTGAPPSLLELVALAAVGSAVAALTLGTVAFAVGAGLRRIVAKRSTFA